MEVIVPVTAASKCGGKSTPSSNASSSLLQLPGELRYRIYDFIIERKSVSLVWAQSPQDAQLKIPQAMTDWSSLGRQYLGLTQVCKQLRSEFLPICQAKTDYHIRSIDVLAFINNFLPEGSQDMHKTVGSIVIDFNAGHIPWENTSAIDILPPIRMYHAANATRTQLNVTFLMENHIANERDIVKDLQHLLQSTSQKWRRFIQDAATQIVVDTGNWSFSLEVYVRGDYFETLAKEFGVVKGMWSCFLRGDTLKKSSTQKYS